MTQEQFEIEKLRRARAAETTRRWKLAHPEWQERRNAARREKAAAFKLALAESERKRKAVQDGDLAVYDPSMEGAL